MIFVSYAHEAHELSANEVTNLINYKDKNNLENTNHLDGRNHCDSHDQDIPDCDIHCSGLHLVTALDHSIQILAPLNFKEINHLLKNNFFISPDLDAAIKPPSHS